MNTNRSETVATAERRRSPRRGLREPTTVYLSMRSGDASQRFEAPLLNLNQTGLACRVQRSHMARLDTDQPLAVAFQLPTFKAACDLTGRVVNVTEGANEDQVIVGVEFIEDANWSAVRDALEAALTSGAEQRN